MYTVFFSVKEFDWHYFSIPPHPVDEETHPHDIGINDILKEEKEEKETPSLTPYPPGVPKWSERHYWEEDAGELPMDEYFEWEEKEVPDFYAIFKEAYCSGIYYDLEDNTNYAILLTLEMIKMYEKRTDKCIARWFRELYPLYLLYPTTRYYMKEPLLQHIEEDGTTPHEQELDLVTLAKWVDHFPPSAERLDFGNLIQWNCRTFNLTYNEYVVLEFISYRANGFWIYCEYNKDHKLFINYLNFFRWIMKELAERKDRQGRPYMYRLRQMAKRFHLKQSPHYKQFKESSRFHRHWKVSTEVYNLYELYLAIYWYSHMLLDQEFYITADTSRILRSIFEDFENEKYKEVLLKSLFPLIDKVFKEMLKDHPLFTKEQRMKLYEDAPGRLLFDYWRLVEEYGHKIPVLRKKVDGLMPLTPGNPVRRDLYYYMACDEGKKQENSDVNLTMDLYIKYLELSYENDLWDIRPMWSGDCYNMFPTIEQRREYKHIIELYQQKQDLTKVKGQLKKLLSGKLQYPSLHNKKTKKKKK